MTPHAEITMAAEPWRGAEPSRSKRRRKRKPLTTGERQEADVRTAKRLASAGRDPFRFTARVFEDIEIEPGRVFTPTPYRERWIFAAEGGRRAARLSAEFDLFKTTHDLSNARHFVFRPPPVPKGRVEPQSDKADIGQLRDELKRFSILFNKWTNKLVNEGVVEPLLAFIHVRFDRSLVKWDIHAHCIWIVKDADYNKVFQRISAKFSTPWSNVEPIRNVAALVNYCSQWVVDYGDLKRWPDAALVEFWDLDALRLMRAAGAFARFRRDLDGRTLVRAGDTITVVEKSPLPRYNAPFPGETREGVVGYARLKLDGRKRLFARSGQARRTSSGRLRWRARRRRKGRCRRLP
jgi:hypothetical protein